MERIEGVDLRQWAATDPPLEARLELMARVCDAVQHAHEMGIVHRDLKPENILVRPDGRPVVLDFGVARLAESDVRAATLMTTVGVLVGTIRYMSPEQADARPDGIGPRSDVHTLAVLTCELLTGRLPYEVPEDSVHRALVAVMTRPPLPLVELPARVRAPLQRVLGAALAKDPEARTASAAALADDLRRVAAGRRPLAKPRRPRPAWERLPVRVWLALLSGGALAGILLSAASRPPTPVDFVVGALRPRAQFVRIRGDIDSAMVRLHVLTRTREGLEEALAHCERAGALLRTVESQPWHRQVRAFQSFREGEARYLIAERDYDPAGFERAAEVWLAHSEPAGPARRVAMPDTIGFLGRLLHETPLRAEAAAAMALEDRSRLIDHMGSLTRAARIRERGAVLALGHRGDLAEPVPGADPLQLAHWRAGIGANRVALAVQEWETGERARASLRSGLHLLELAMAEPRTHLDGSSYGSLLHEYGTALLWSAALDRPGDLDSARRVLAEARFVRGQMPGYTSVVHSACALAEAERLSAWRAASPESARASLARAQAALEVRDSEDMRLMPMDRALLELERAAVLVDLGCVERDSSRFSAAASALRGLFQWFDDRRAPRLALRILLLSYRIAAQRAAIAPAPVHDVRLRSITEQMLGPLARSGDQRLDRLHFDAKERAYHGPPRPYALDYPSPVPF